MTQAAQIPTLLSSVILSEAKNLSSPAYIRSFAGAQDDDGTAMHTARRKGESYGTEYSGFYAKENTDAPAGDRHCPAAFTAKSVFVKNEAPDLNTLEGRAAYLKTLGWEIDRDSESFRSVAVPQKLEGIMAQYNKIQLKQGFDLNKHLGESCRQYCYDVTNYPGGAGKVIVSLYLQNGQVIAGDVHSTAVNGFMHGLSRSEAGASASPAPSPRPTGK